MTTLQKVIKYCAIGLAVFICLLIVSAVVSGVKVFTGVFDYIRRDKTEEVKDNNYSEVIKVENEINALDLNLKGASLVIKQGSELSVEVNDKNIKVSQNDNILKIVDRSNKLVNKDVRNLVITIPLNISFDNVKIETGAGKVSIDGINTRILDMELGAGSVLLENISSDKTSIETGAGNVNIENSSLNDLDLELGVGEINIDADITGTSSIECGVGSLKLNLNYPSSMYKLDLEKGLGEISVNGNKILKNTLIGDGDNYIKVEGGVGSIKINTLEE